TGCLSTWLTGCQSEHNAKSPEPGGGQLDSQPGTAPGIYRLPRHFFAPGLAEGSKGEAVAAMQLQLKQLGYLPANKSIDGNFDQATTQALRELQRVRNVPVTGVVDKETLSAMRNSGCG